MAKLEISGLGRRPHYGQQEAEECLRGMRPYGFAGDALWQTLTAESMAQAVFKEIPNRLDGIASLMTRTGIGTVADDAALFLADALRAEARAMRLALAAVRDDDEGWIKPPPAPKRRRAGK